MSNQKSHSPSVVAFASVEDMSMKIRQKSQLKGRQADDASLREVLALLQMDDKALQQRRDLLIEHLHKINDKFRGLHERHLVAFHSSHWAKKVDDDPARAAPGRWLLCSAPCRTRRIMLPAPSGADSVRSAGRATCPKPVPE
jgi:hypothetical protein